MLYNAQCTQCTMYKEHNTQCKQHTTQHYTLCIWASPSICPMCPAAAKVRPTEQDQCNDNRMTDTQVAAHSNTINWWELARLLGSMNSTSLDSTTLDSTTSYFPHSLSTTLGFSNPWLDSTTLGFNNPWIQQPLDSTTFRFNKKNSPTFNNPWTTPELNNTWIQQTWIQKTLDSTILNSTILGFNQLEFNNPCFHWCLESIILNLKIIMFPTETGLSETLPGRV